MQLDPTATDAPLAGRDMALDVVPTVQPFYDTATSTLTYVVHDPATRDAVVIDSVLDYDPLSSSTSTRGVQVVCGFLLEHGLRLRYVLETHAHADHLTAAQWIKRRFGAPVVIGEHIRDVQKTFKRLLDLEGLAVDGSQFDELVADGDVVRAGSLTIRTLATPGHTPACVSYVVGDAVFTGDALFMDDYGTGRCDFPEGSADALYHSVHDWLYSLPDETRVFTCHDYRPGGRPLRWQTTIGVSKASNVQLRAETTRDDYVRFRRERDEKLPPPRLLYPSVQVNVAAGRLPAPHRGGRRYLTVPLNPGRTTADDGTPVDTKVLSDA
jgi:glyoxylase-like metal-dependent hydrolase (beta-lactamase superfamily II)